MTSPGSELILFVCSANICRSPLGELLLRQGLADLPGIRVESAGTQARAGAALCSLVSEQFVRGEQASGLPAHPVHRSRRVTADLLAEATLILTAARDIRSEVVRMAPQVRDRTYTMREVAFLGEGFAPGASARRVGVVSHFAMHLDGARAAKGPVPSRRAGWWRMRSVDGRDIIDGHTHGAREHHRTLQDVAEASETILGQLGGRAVR